MSAPAASAERARAPGASASSSAGDVRSGTPPRSASSPSAPDEPDDSALESSATFGGDTPFAVVIADAAAACARAAEAAAAPAPALTAAGERGERGERFGLPPDVGEPRGLREVGDNDGLGADPADPAVVPARAPRAPVTAKAEGEVTGLHTVSSARSRLTLSASRWAWQISPRAGGDETSAAGALAAGVGASPELVPAAPSSSDAAVAAPTARVSTQAGLRIASAACRSSRAAAPSRASRPRRDTSVDAEGVAVGGSRPSAAASSKRVAISSRDSSLIRASCAASTVRSSRLSWSEFRRCCAISLSASSSAPSSSWRCALASCNCASS